MMGGWGLDGGAFWRGGGIEIRVLSLLMHLYCEGVAIVQSEAFYCCRVSRAAESNLPKTLSLAVDNE